MAVISAQRDLVFNLKKETCLNVGILSKLQPMPADLARQILKEDALEKPTQTVFNHLSYYLVSIIDPQKCGSLPWPLYDTRTERSYRTEISAFIYDYSSKGLLSPVLSSYLVNPGCYKVTVLIFQMTQLAVQEMLKTKMQREQQKKLYNDVTEKYKSNKKDGFMKSIESETQLMFNKFSNYLVRRDVLEKIAEKLRNQITKIETTLQSTNAKELICDLVDNFIADKTSLDEGFMSDILLLKNINASPKIFETLLLDVDSKMEAMEQEWEKRTGTFLSLCKKTAKSTEELLDRHTGEADKSSYMIEYSPGKDIICTKELEKHVSSEQKYILKNIVKDDTLVFPNLIRGFAISMCYILKSIEVGDDLFKFNEYLMGNKRSYSEIIFAMKILNERVFKAESKLQLSPESFNQSIASKDMSELPSLPDLSELKMNEFHSQLLFDVFTPLSLSKNLFNLKRKQREGTFVRPPPKSRLTPYYQETRVDFLKNLLSTRTTKLPNTSNNIHNLSMISQANINETIAECSSGFTKQQILRLLSTKKSSMKKKNRSLRPNIHIKEGALFNESIISNNSSGSNDVFRSHSSPNLFDNRETRHKGRARRLSIMAEDCTSLLDVSAISLLDKDSKNNSPHSCMESTRNITCSSPLPQIKITPVAETKIINILNEITDSHINAKQEIRKELEKEEVQEFRKDIKDKPESTPKNGIQIKNKSSSIEKIINRFKKVRATVLPMDKSVDDFPNLTILEEKENINLLNINPYTENTPLLPDLLSPSCSMLTMKSNDYLDQLCFDLDKVECKKPRESLGTALGVDQTFLDQFDLID